MSWACHVALWGKEGCLQDFDGETWGKRPLGIPRQRYNNNIYLFIYCNWVVTKWQWLFYM